MSSYTCQILRDRNSLTIGEAQIPKSLEANIGDVTSFDITVHYSPGGSGGLSTTGVSPSVSAVPVKVGAQIDTTVAADDPSVKVTSNDSPQPILTEGDIGTWHFSLTGNDGGTFKLRSKVEALDGDGKTSLAVTNASVNFEVHKTLSSRVKSFFAGIGWLANALQAIGVLGAICLGVWAYIKREAIKVIVDDVASRLKPKKRGS